MEHSTVMENTNWLVGDGKKINFWLDSWFGDSIANILNLPDHITQHFPPMLHSYIQNQQWNMLEQNVFNITS